MSLYLVGTDLYADTPAELAAAATRLGRNPCVVAAGTPAERLEVTSRQARIVYEWDNVHLLAPGQAAMVLEARRLGVAIDIERLRRLPAAFARDMAYAAGRSRDESFVPRRVQMSRQAGFRLPPHTVSVAAPSRFANPYRAARRTAEANRAAVDEYSAYLKRNPQLVADARLELAGLNLACWCRPQLACHADVLLALVNEGKGERDDIGA